jgi:O-antigen biosynthesis protein WbqP
MLKRAFDIVFSILFLLLLSPLLLILALLIKATSKGPILYWSSRVAKFRTMQNDTPQIPTHLLSKPTAYLTPIGGLLRRSSLDELPQLFSILTGKLSFVGPRPALFNQKDLMGLRTDRGIHRIVPGLTGWAQINGRDELPIPVKVQFDYEYMQRRSLKFDLYIIFKTAFKVVRGDGIQH